MKKTNCQGKDCSAEVYKDNLCVKHYEEANPNIKGWKCDICQRLCGEDEQFTTLAEKQNTNDPKVAEEFRKKYPYGITYCPECEDKEKEEAKKVKNPCHLCENKEGKNKVSPMVVVKGDTFNKIDERSGKKKEYQFCDDCYKATFKC